MAGNKGINNVISDTRKELANLINKALSIGVPSSVMQLILENLLFEVKQVVEYDQKQELEQENKNDEVEQEVWQDSVDQENTSNE